jgi:hypothetical protein
MPSAHAVADVDRTVCQEPGLLPGFGALLYET